MKKIEIHILGAEYTETKAGLELYEELFHWLPNCTHLIFILCGPFIGESGNCNSLNYSLCKSCSNNNEIINNTTNKKMKCANYLEIKLEKGYYHDLCNNNVININNTNLLICFHSGLHDTVVNDKYEISLNTSWKETVNIIKNSNKPCIFTGFTEDEIISDAAVLKSWNCNFFQLPQINPFRGLYAYPETINSNKFYYANHSYLIVKGNNNSNNNNNIN